LALGVQQHLTAQQQESRGYLVSVVALPKILLATELSVAQAAAVVETQLSAAPV